MWIRYSEFSRLKRQDVKIVQGAALKINTDCREVLYTNNEVTQQALRFDYLILATGICPQWPVSSDATEKISFVDDVSKYAEDIRAARERGVAVIGGGMFSLWWLPVLLDFTNDIYDPAFRCGRS